MGRPVKRRLWPRRRPPVSLLKKAEDGGPMFRGVYDQHGNLKKIIRNWRT
jgi:hypothetical protein